MSQSSVKFGKKRVFLVGTINFMTITAEVATSKFVLYVDVLKIHHFQRCADENIVDRAQIMDHAQIRDRFKEIQYT